MAKCVSSGLVSAIANEKDRLYGLQFHPEVDLSVEGKKMMHNFLLKVCGFSGSFTMEDRQKRCVEYIKETVGNKKVGRGITSTTIRSIIYNVLLLFIYLFLRF